MLALMALALATATQEARPITMGTGNEVYATCTSSAPDDQYACLLWTTGVAQSATFVTAELRHCLFAMPAAVNGRQAVDVLVRYLRDHPEQRHQPGAVLALKALRDAFPCAKPGPQ